MVRLLWAIGLLLSLLAVSSATEAQPLGAATDDAGAGAEVSVPGTLTPEQADGLVAGLTDAQARRLLLSELQARATTATDSDAEVALGGLLSALSGESPEITDTIRATVLSVTQLPESFARLGDAFAPGGDPSVLYYLLFVLAAAIGGGFLLERAARPLLAGAERRTRPDPADGRGMRAGRFGLELFLRLASIALFLIGARVVYVVLDPDHDPTYFTVSGLVLAVAEWRLLALVARLILAPDLPQRRVVPFDDATARDAYHWVLALITYDAFAYRLLDILRRYGLSDANHSVIMVVAALGMVALFVGLFWRLRSPVAAILMGRDPSPARALLASLWHLPMIAFLLGNYVIWAFNKLAGQDHEAAAAYYSLLVVIAIPVVDRLVGLLLDAVFPRSRAEAGAEPAKRPAAAQAIQRCARIVLVVFAALLLAEAWGVEVIALYETPLGARVAEAFVNIMAALLIAYVAWDVIRSTIDRKIAESRPDPDEAAEGEGEGGGAAHPGARLLTLLPLLRSVIMATLLVMVVMIVLSSLGVDIGPLLAGAGVVGLAVGLGAQRLVQDIVSGIFFLIDDAFRVGEYVELSELKGTIESLSLRSMRLRHQRGAVQTIPFGDITWVKNHSRDWVIVKLEIRVPFDTDIEKVRKIIKRIGIAMQEEDQFRGSLLAPLKSQGVYQMEDSFMVVRVKFTSIPGQQFMIRREAYARIKQAFEENGIPFARPQVTVHVPGAGDPAAAAAAASAVGQQRGAPTAAE